MCRVRKFFFWRGGGQLQRPFLKKEITLEEIYPLLWVLVNFKCLLQWGHTLAIPMLSRRTFAEPSCKRKFHGRDLIVTWGLVGFKCDPLWEAHYINIYIYAFSRCFIQSDLRSVNCQIHVVQGQSPQDQCKVTVSALLKCTTVVAGIRAHNFQATSLLARFLNHQCPIEQWGLIF